MDDRAQLKSRFKGYKPPEAKSTPIITDQFNEQRTVMPEGFDTINLKVTRTQGMGITKSSFAVNFIVEMSPEAMAACKKYRFGREMVYCKDVEPDPNMNVWLKNLYYIFLIIFRKKWSISINDLVKGRTVKTKDVMEMLEIEERIQQAAETFASILRKSAWFGGEEIIRL